MIPVMLPRLPRYEDVSNLLRKMDESQVYTNMGPISVEFKEELSDYLNVPSGNICLLANATLAIQGLLEISIAAEWVVPDWTFAATGLAVIGARKNIVLADVNIDDWELDISACQTPKNGILRGFIPVAPFGKTPNILKWKEFDHVIHDAAASFGSPPPDVLDLNSTSAIVYSLHATKVIPAGEGAVVVCGSEKMANALQRWSNFGFDGNRKSVSIGTNAKLSEIACAYGLASLKMRDIEIQEWKFALEASKVASAGKDWQTFISSLSGIRPYWIARFQDESTRNHVISQLEIAGIQSRKWWPVPLSQMAAFENFVPSVPNPKSLSLAETTLGLPMFRDLKCEQVDAIVSEIDKALEVGRFG